MFREEFRTESLTDILLNLVDIALSYRTCMKNLVPQSEPLSSKCLMPNPLFDTYNNRMSYVKITQEAPLKNQPVTGALLAHFDFSEDADKILRRSFTAANLSIKLDSKSVVTKVSGKFESQFCDHLAYGQIKFVNSKSMMVGTAQWLARWLMSPKTKFRILIIALFFNISLLAEHALKLIQGPDDYLSCAFSDFGSFLRHPKGSHDMCKRVEFNIWPTYRTRLNFGCMGAQGMVARPTMEA
ncbi:hypothetical protein VNO77_19819 [Canavalia gladiata]|uniref:Uncharacterized protein n=1 Tax=Canavalia gladiata TaxID=3824 RepID=A0AAN9QKV1_CANGL